MIFSYSSPSHIYPIMDRVIHSITRITSKREPRNGEYIQLYYKYNSQNIIHVTKKKNVVCSACILSKAITGRNCPYYDPDTYSIDCRCPQFVNFIGYGKVTDVVHYENFNEIKNKDVWAASQGFSTIEDAMEYHEMLIGDKWETYPITVIDWEYLGRRK